MPRTRAALRSNAIVEDEVDLATNTALPSTPVKDREPLGEISSNAQEESMNAKTFQKVPTKAKKIKGAKRGRKKKTENPEPDAEVLEDENQSETSSAVEDACDDLMKNRHHGKLDHVPSPDTYHCSH